MGLAARFIIAARMLLVDHTVYARSDCCRHAVTLAMRCHDRGAGAVGSASRNEPLLRTLILTRRLAHSQL